MIVPDQPCGGHERAVNLFVGEVQGRGNSHQRLTFVIISHLAETGIDEIDLGRLLSSSRGSFTAMRMSEIVSAE